MNTNTEIPDICPFCQSLNPPANKFCANCGKQLKESELSTTISKQIMIYAISFLLAPLGLWWAVKYIKSSNPKAKMIGWVAVILTVTALVATISLAGTIMGMFSSQININGDPYSNLGI